MILCMFSCLQCTRASSLPHHKHRWCLVASLDPGWCKHWLTVVVPLNSDLKEEVGSRTVLSSYTVSTNSSCHRRKDSVRPPSHTVDSQETRCQIWSCIHFHVFSQETCNKVCPLKNNEHISWFYISVHDSSRMHVFQCTAELNKVLPYCSLRN